MPDFQSNEDALNQLQLLLQKHLVGDSILLVLDDVWNESLSVLEKLIFPIQNYKVLVTTRCRFPQYKYTYKLQLLSDNDAMVLFCNYAFEGGKYNGRRDLVDKVKATNVVNSTVSNLTIVLQCMCLKHLISKV